MTAPRTYLEDRRHRRSGLIGSKLVTKLRQRRHEAVPASPASGVNTLTGEGLTEALEGAAVAVDVSTSPSFEDIAALKFFRTSTSNLLDAEAAAGVGHHVAADARLAETRFDHWLNLSTIGNSQLVLVAQMGDPSGPQPGEQAVALLEPVDGP